LAVNDTVGTPEPTTPGWVLRERFWRPLNITQRQLADALGVSGPRLHQVLSGRNPIRAEMALRLGLAFGTGPEFWLEMQMDVDLFRATELLRSDLGQIRLLRRAHEQPF
jgi:addiction module HigA family antidote